MSVRGRLNRALRDRTGYEMRRVRTPPGGRLPERPPAPATTQVLPARAASPRLVTAPTFVLSSVRSGSTLLRLVLDSHPDICAPHELHLRRIESSAGGSARLALDALGVDADELRYLLWDRLLYRELQRSGKHHYVNKTPNDALIWPKLLACWPDARFIHLHRHPAAIMQSWAARKRKWTRDQVANDILAYATGMEQARAAVDGLVVRYEDLTTDPGEQARRMCEWLGVDWDPHMLAYATAGHSGMQAGLGDWSAQIRSGAIQPAKPIPVDDLPDILRPIAEAWGYL